MGRHSIELPAAGAGRPLPLSGILWFWRQSRLPDPQKKKWREADWWQRAVRHTGLPVLKSGSQTEHMGSPLC